MACWFTHTDGVGRAIIWKKAERPPVWETSNCNVLLRLNFKLVDEFVYKGRIDGFSMNSTRAVLILARLISSSLRQCFAGIGDTEAWVIELEWIKYHDPQSP